MAGCTAKVVRTELMKILAAEYVCLAFNLPNGSGTLWSIMEQDMNELGSNEPFADQVQILEFLSIFFSQELVDSISNNLQALAKSRLGIEYTLRRPKADIGKAIIEGLQEEALERRSPLGHFLGVLTSLFDELDDADEKVSDGPQDQGRGAAHLSGTKAKEVSGGGGGDGVGINTRKQLSSNLGGEEANGGGRDEGEGSNTHKQWGSNSGGEEAGGGDDQQADNIRLKVWEEANTRLVWLLAYTTPPRDKTGRNMELRDRSKEFTKVVGHRPNLLYNPLHSVHGVVNLYHGTRSSSLQSFAVAGIDPDYTTNEFSRRQAFYVTNSVQYAYEFPLHYHPSRNVLDPVAVMEFKVRVEVLHGEQPPTIDSVPFSVKRFRGPNEEWKKFCVANMLRRDVRVQFDLASKPHSHDIVIGPICKGVTMHGDVGVVGIDLPNNVYLTQVAFCTERARAWLEQQFRIVYREQRREEK